MSEVELAVIDMATSQVRRLEVAVHYSGEEVTGRKTRIRNEIEGKVAQARPCPKSAYVLDVFEGQQFVDHWAIVG